MDIKEFILNKKEELNIDIIKISDGRPSNFLSDRLVERIEEGKITEFEDVNIDDKLNVENVFEDYKSIIVIGKSYLNDYRSEVAYNKGLLSRSSWGKDYHHVLKKDMESLILELEKEYGGRYESYVDTGPLVDRNLAYTSGVGFYGKNCSIINEDYGSFVFIGYIITDLYIERDSIVDEDCGKCTRCMDYCPTKAIEAPYKLNPKRCISYLTQTKEKIPYALRDKMGAKIYGCDTCQDVCPKNAKVEMPNNDEFIPLKTDGYLDIDEILFMSNKEFKRKYGDMSGSWRGKNILKRNAIIAIGNKKDRKYLSVLFDLLSDDSQIIVEYSLWSILKLDKVEGRKLIDEYINYKGLNEELMEEYFNLKKYFKI